MTTCTAKVQNTTFGTVALLFKTCFKKNLCPYSIFALAPLP